jgi:hypothetical protein
VYNYSVVTTEPEGEDVYYYIEWGDGTNTEWLGPFNSGTPTSAQKSWSVGATYTVRTKAKDINQVIGNWSEPLTVTILMNNPPNTPTISGLARGIVGINYLYKFITTEPDGDTVSYYIDWGDGNTSGWLGPYTSGLQVEIRHRWTQKGTYIIQVKAKDTYGAESSWGVLAVSVPTNMDTRSYSLEQLNQNSQTSLIINQASHTYI